MRDLTKLQELLDREHVLKVQLKKVQDEIDFEKYTLVTREINLGDIVTNQGKEYRVAEIDYRWFPQKAYLVGNPRKANGEFGNQRRNLFDSWEKKQ